jgi:hypothetical protein
MNHDYERSNPYTCRMVLILSSEPLAPPFHAPFPVLLSRVSPLPSSLLKLSNGVYISAQAFLFVLMTLSVNKINGKDPNYS